MLNHLQEDTAPATSTTTARMNGPAHGGETDLTGVEIIIKGLEIRILFSVCVTLALKTLKQKLDNRLFVIRLHIVTNIRSFSFRKQS